jgi:hypothetical protein
MARATYVLRNGELVEKSTGTVLSMPERDGLCMPQIIHDTPPYRSPIDGRPIGGRAARREDLKRNNCIEWDSSMSPTRGKAEFKNARFAKKHGLKLSEKIAHA